jgi:hypothetical protein
MAMLSKPLSHGALRITGREIGKAWCVLVGLMLLLSFQVVGIIASIYLWVLVSSYLIDFGFTKWLSVVIGLLTAYLFGLFLAVYVWTPYVKSNMFRAAEIRATGQRAGDSRRGMQPDASARVRA